MYLLYDLQTAIQTIAFVIHKILLALRAVPKWPFTDMLTDIESLWYMYS